MFINERLLSKKKYISDLKSAASNAHICTYLFKLKS